MWWIQGSYQFMDFAVIVLPVVYHSLAKHVKLHSAHKYRTRWSYCFGFPGWVGVLPGQLTQRFLCYGTVSNQEFPEQRILHDRSASLNSQ